MTLRHKQAFSLFLMKAYYFFTRSKNFKLMLTQPDISEDELSTIITPTLVLAGAKDVIREEHTRLIARCIPGSELKILPGENHFSYVLNTDKIYDIIKAFLGV